MASHVVNGSYVPLGLNHGNQFFIHAVLADGLANKDTFDIVVPDTVPEDAVPFSMVCYSLAGGVYTLDADIGAITSHSVSTRTTRITATGNVAAGSRVILGYIGL